MDRNLAELYWPIPAPSGQRHGGVYIYSVEIIWIVPEALHALELCVVVGN